ncbi:MAG: OmpR family signal transduction histidine kinase [Candidatus Aminicenantes bacterium]|nr:OmpR family signal transduction histidine kinase [Candidatus Aminicenantes bacterium]
MRQRHRVIFLFGAGIVLPSLLLSYLALRGIQNDRALVEKERLEDTRRAADKVVRAVDDAVTAVERALERTVAGQSGRPSEEIPPALEKLAAGNPLVEQSFYMHDFKDIRFPNAKLLYGADGGRGAGQSPSPDLGHLTGIQAARELEFRQRDNAQALAAYRRALQAARDPVHKGQILTAVARVQRKSGLLKEALATYENIVRDYGGITTPEGLPLGPSASLEICALSLELQDISKSIQTALDLYRSLLRTEWTLERAEFDFFSERIKTRIQVTFPNRPGGFDLEKYQGEFRKLEAEEAQQRKKTERMIAFEQGAPPALEAKIRGGEPEPDRPFTRLTLDLGNESYFVSLRKPSAPAVNASDPAWGIIIDAERLREDVLSPALREYFPAPDITWCVKAKDGAAVMSSADPPAGPVTVRTNFAANTPDWTLEFHQPPPRLLKTFLISRRGLYLMVFLLIAGMFVFGLALTIRAVSHELEVARMKSDFVSTVSHEFKSPLTSIRQLAEMLQSGRVPSEERRQQYYDVLLEQSERLALLTDNILSLARIEEGRAEFTFESTDVSALLTSVVSSIQERVRHEGFAIELQAAGSIPFVAADRSALLQAVTNLIDNAIKYSGGSKKILVTAIIEEQSLAISVRDFGIGIKKEDIPKLFERFYRGGDELTRSVKGSGLGLTLVKEIVQAHRGKVRVESEPGKGSTFIILLPLPQGEVS